MFRTTFLFALVLLSCGRNKPASTPVGDEVRARVNGVPITALEVAQRLVGGAERATPAQKQTALEQAISEELQAQRALELGLAAGETDAGVPTDAKGRDARRHARAKTFRMSELLDKAVVTPEEARAWFEVHAARVQHQLQLQALTLPSRAAADTFVAALSSGRSFEDAAAAQFPELEASNPWAPVSMKWSTVPPPWWPELEALDPGKTSGVITDQQGHYWVLKLVERKATAVTFEEAAPAIQATLQAARFEEHLKSSEQELRAKAKVELLAPPQT